MITKQQVLEALEALPTDGINPQVTGGNSCVYTSEDGLRHCIAGQVIVNLGGRVPEYDNSDNASVVNILLCYYDTGLQFSHDAKEVLTYAQCLADNMYPWGKVVTLVKDRFNEQ